MKTRFGTLLLLLVFLFSGIVGCATRVDWGARVGHYTFDQAVAEFGPPDKQAKLSDGQTVAEWITRYNSGPSVSVGLGYHRYPASVGMVHSTGAHYYERKLRLTFDTNNVLTQWVRN